MGFDLIAQEGDRYAVEAQVRRVNAGKIRLQIPSCKLEQDIIVTTTIAHQIAEWCGSGTVQLKKSYIIGSDTYYLPATLAIAKDFGIALRIKGNYKVNKDYGMCLRVLDPHAATIKGFLEISYDLMESVKGWWPIKSADDVIVDVSGNIIKSEKGSKLNVHKIPSYYWVGVTAPYMLYSMRQTMMEIAGFVAGNKDSVNTAYIRDTFDAVHAAFINLIGEMMNMMPLALITDDMQKIVGDFHVVVMETYMKMPMYIDRTNAHEFISAYSSDKITETIGRLKSIMFLKLYENPAIAISAVRDSAYDAHKKVANPNQKYDKHAVLLRNIRSRSTIYAIKSILESTMFSQAPYGDPNGGAYVDFIFGENGEFSENLDDQIFDLFKIVTAASNDLETIEQYGVHSLFAVFRANNAAKALPLYAGEPFDVKSVAKALESIKVSMTTIRAGNGSGALSYLIKDTVDQCYDNCVMALDMAKGHTVSKASEELARFCMTAKRDIDSLMSKASKYSPYQCFIEKMPLPYMLAGIRRLILMTDTLFDNDIDFYWDKALLVRDGLISLSKHMSITQEKESDIAETLCMRLGNKNNTSLDTMYQINDIRVDVLKVLCGLWGDVYGQMSGENFEIYKALAGGDSKNYGPTFVVEGQQNAKNPFPKGGKISESDVTPIDEAGVLLAKIIIADNALVLGHLINTLIGKISLADATDLSSSGRAILKTVLTWACINYDQFQHGKKDGVQAIKLAASSILEKVVNAALKEAGATTIAAQLPPHHTPKTILMMTVIMRKLLNLSVTTTDDHPHAMMTDIVHITDNCKLLEKAKLDWGVKQALITVHDVMENFLKELSQPHLAKEAGEMFDFLAHVVDEKPTSQMQLLEME